MCPLCFANVALAVAGAVIAGGGVAQLKNLASSVTRQLNPANTKEK